MQRPTGAFNRVGPLQRGRRIMPASSLRRKTPPRVHMWAITVCDIAIIHIRFYRHSLEHVPSSPEKRSPPASGGLVRDQITSPPSSIDDPAGSPGISDNLLTMAVPMRPAAVTGARRAAPTGSRLGPAPRHLLRTVRPGAPARRIARSATPQVRFRDARSREGGADRAARSAAVTVSAYIQRCRIQLSKQPASRISRVGASPRPCCSSPLATR